MHVREKVELGCHRKHIIRSDSLVRTISWMQKLPSGGRLHPNTAIYGGSNIILALVTRLPKDFMPESLFKCEWVIYVRQQHTCVSQKCGLADGRLGGEHGRHRIARQPRIGELWSDGMGIDGQLTVARTATGT